jgi:hypothetical protein
MAFFVLVGTVGVSGCPDNEVRSYLSKTGKLHDYLELLSDAVCQLEVNNPDHLDAAKRICPGGPGDKKAVPSYPP